MFDTYLIYDYVIAMAQDVGDTFMIGVKDIYNLLNSGDQKVIWTTRDYMITFQNLAGCYYIDLFG